MRRTDSTDRRQHRRKRATVPIELRCEGVTSLMRIETSDLSIGGCYVETMFPQPVASRLRITLGLGDTRVQAAAVVVTCTPQFGSGIEFINMSDSHREALSRWLEALPEA